MAKKLIVNADDFGRTHAVSQGILAAHRDGIVTSATAMMNMSGAAHDVERALAEAPGLGLGVHLVFTAGRPLLPPEWVPSLIDEHGHFLPADAVLAEPNRLQPDELRSEFKAQISAFEHAAERRPDHIDCHHHAHTHPHFFAVYIDVAYDLDLPARIPFPRTEAEVERISRLPGVGVDMPLDAAKALLRENLQRLAEQPVRSADRFVDSFFGDGVSVDGLLALLDGLPDGVTEIMCHPGYVDEALAAESSYTAPRQAEIAVLTDPRVKQRIAERGIELVTYAAVRA